MTYPYNNVVMPLPTHLAVDAVIGGGRDGPEKQLWARHAESASVWQGHWMLLRLEGASLVGALALGPVVSEVGAHKPL